jgi:hypothetical protein
LVIIIVYEVHGAGWNFLGFAIAAWNPGILSFEVDVAVAVTVFTNLP